VTFVRFEQRAQRRRADAGVVVAGELGIHVQNYKRCSAQPLTDASADGSCAG
jgi:hypothetical protein